jgi:hypothetical protein
MFTLFGKPKNELVYNRDTWDEWSNALGGITKSSAGITITFSDAAYRYTSLSVPDIKSTTKYGILYSIKANTLSAKKVVGLYELTNDFIDMVISGETGNKKLTITTMADITSKIFVIQQNGLGDADLSVLFDAFRMFELPAGSQIETDFANFTADQLDAKYPF